MSRKGWANLAPAQRRRYDRAGITPSGYEAGASLAAARGHGATPERPERAERTPERYRPYLRRRTKPIRVVTTSGVITVSGMTSADRSIVGKHGNAIRRHLEIEGMTRPVILSTYSGTAGTRSLSDFEGRTVTGYVGDSDDLTADIAFEYRSSVIDALYFAGQLNFESIYQTASAA